MISCIKCVLVANESFTTFKFLMPMANYFKNKKLEVRLACSDKEYSDAELFIDDIKTSGVHLDIINIERHISLLKDISSFVLLVRYFRNNKFHVVHTHTSKAGILGRIAAFVCRVPIILHTTHDYAFTEKTNIINRYFIIWMERLVALFTDRIYFVSEAEKNRCLIYRIARKSKTLYTGPVGLSLNEFSQNKINNNIQYMIRTKYNIPSDKLIIGTVSRLVPHKRVDIFLRACAIAFEKNRKLFFIIVGGGPMLMKLESLASNIGLKENVIFTGFIKDSKEIPVIMSIFDIFCLPTIKEGFGIVFAEAGVLSKPAIGCDIPPINYVISNNETGLLCKPDDPKDFARAILKLSGDDKKRIEMGIAARRRAKYLFDERFAYEKIYQDYIKLFGIKELKK